ncbi:hypothetical protein BpHYR1_032258 [Brachionus plicatilis]|uniref:Uncharacterized protein n=1 Tax=Brachionus plicatilis TaxID=10195 RepID=A0A3M7QD67_BRAPC|nr:hypothetical protein BpHYR1_032258 [Brachionus plicatilis]
MYRIICLYASNERQLSLKSKFLKKKTKIFGSSSLSSGLKRVLGFVLTPIFSDFGQIWLFH